MNKNYLRVKICGITNLEDAQYAIECGADALGFVFYDKSPRYITPEDAKVIIDNLPPFVEKVGLFVNVDVNKINSICKDSGITLAQIHFEVDKIFIDSIDIAALPVVRAKCQQDVHLYADSYRLVDAFCEAYGGEGKRLNLEWFEGVDCSKIILAGGLTPNNLNEIKKYGFYAVDVSSGVELLKGKKDKKTIESFISNAKSI